MMALLGLGFCLAGCESSSGSSATSAAQTGAVAELKDDDLPVQADFDDEATKQISATNYKAELDTLEKEIAAP